MTVTPLPRLRAGALRLLVLLLVVGAIGAAAAGHGAMRWESVRTEAMALHDHVAEYPLAPIVFVAIMVAGSLVFVPRTILVAAGGLLFGFWPGLAWGTIGSTLGALAGFLLARYVNAGLVDAATLPRLAPALRAADRSGWRAIAVLRLLPLPHTPVNYALGVTRISFWSYAIGSAIGMVPATLVCAQLGANGNTVLSGGDWLLSTLATLVLISLSLILPRLKIVRRSLRTGAD